MYTHTHTHMYTYTYAHTCTCTHKHAHTCTHTRDCLQTHVLSVAASDPHPSTQGVGCSLIVKHPELDKPCNKFPWERRGRERPKYAKEELDTAFH